MKYMMIMRDSDEAIQATGQLPFEDIVIAMGRYNEELVDAGVLVAVEGLTEPQEGFVVDFGADPPRITDGRYGAADALFSGFWIVQVNGRDEAGEWGRRCPLGPGSKLEMRRFSETEDLPQDNEYVQKMKAWREECGTDRPLSRE